MMLFEKYNLLAEEGLFADLPKCFDGLTRESREYQTEAFKRFCYYFEKGKKTKPIHLLFQMATGSGKTHIMAGLMLYLYEKGYRNFLFFVHSTAILEKTRENFLAIGSEKCLFKNGIAVQEVSNFEFVREDAINICMKSIQKLHIDLTTPKEDMLSLEDLQGKKIVMLADEAHHLNTETKKSLNKTEEEEKQSWEGTVMNILNSNAENLLLDFTATMDMENKTLMEKYKEKLIYKYTLEEFRNDGYSKDVFSLQTTIDATDESERLFRRTILACVVNEFRRMLALENGIEMKPCILVKLKLKKDAKTAMEEFSTKLETIENIDWIFNINANDENSKILVRAIEFLKNHNITGKRLIEILKSSFAKELIHIATDNHKEDHILNAMEKNQIRMIYDVDRLTEGWDVLNLFDIVRLYETRDNSTTKEAQLIGRGARYCPFELQGFDGKFTRKFDGEQPYHILRPLEQMHYHCQNESKFISELNRALIKEGLKDEKRYATTVVVKEKFKQTDVYKTFAVYLNSQVPKEYGIFNQEEIKEDYNLNEPIKIRCENFTIKSEKLLQNNLQAQNDKKQGGETQIFHFKDFLCSQVINAMDFKEFNGFFHFKNIKQKFPQVNSRKEFIESILGNIEINAVNFNGNYSNLITQALQIVKNRIEGNYTEYVGTKEFNRKKYVITTVGDKTLYSKEQKQLTTNYEFLAQENIDATGEEQEFLSFVNEKLGNIRSKTEYFWVIRNLKFFEIYTFKAGQKFEPDFIILSKLKNGETANMQIFIEPKGWHLLEKDSFKEDFLKQINTIFDSTKIKGLGFFNSQSTEVKQTFEKEFRGVFNIVN
jgi:type III restriction enzyme